MTTTALLPIITSRSARVTSSQCRRRRWLAYEAPNGAAGVRGWERRKHSLPLLTGIHQHKTIEALLTGATVEEAARLGRQGYMEDVTRRGLECELPVTLEETAGEQAALIEAMTYAWARVRMPYYAEHFNIITVEKELTVQLADDVTLAARCDALLERKDDHRMFVFNPKTVNSADERWMRQWERDLQVMTEMMAAEAWLGKPVAGVIVEGFIKGRRVGVDERLVEVRDKEKKPERYVQQSRLLYGYKCDGNPPLEPERYDHEYSRAKGWHKFEVWKDEGLRKLSASQGVENPLAYWVNWIPEEAVADCFVTVPPVYWDSRMAASATRQLVADERRIRAARQLVDEAIEAHGAESDEVAALLDEGFEMNTHSCTYPSECPMVAACWEAGVASAMQESGLYVPRVSNHPSEVEA